MRGPACRSHWLLLRCLQTPLAVPAFYLPLSAYPRPPSRSSGIVVRLTERAFSQCFPSLKLYESVRRDQCTDDRHFLTLVRDVTGGQALQL